MFRPLPAVISCQYPPPVGCLRLVMRANGGSDECIVREVLDHRCYGIRLRADPASVLDLGANAGFATLYFARAYPRAHLACVEPMPGNLQSLRRNLELNQVDAKVIPAAIAAADGPILMEIAAMDYGHRVTELSCRESIEVTAVSMPTTLKHLGWGRVGLLKVDIEGYERTLLGSDCDWLQLVDALCIECHSGYGESDLQAVADKFGFTFPQRVHGLWLMTRGSA